MEELLRETENILHHRRLTEERLVRLLKVAEIDSPLGLIQSLVLDYHHSRFNLFLSQMTTMFKKAPKPVDKGALLIVIQDAWNYFPHLSLQGKCPAEIAFCQADDARALLQ
jgi:hypothetical protein